MQKIPTNDIFPEYKCPVCGRNFIPAIEHVFKDFGRFYCSWTCYKHRFDNGVPDKPKLKYRKVYQYDTKGGYVREHKSARVAAEFIKGSESGLRAACGKHKKYKGYLWRYEGDEMSEMQR